MVWGGSCVEERTASDRRRRRRRHLDAEVAQRRAHSRRRDVPTLSRFAGVGALAIGLVASSACSSTASFRAVGAATAGTAGSVPAAGSGSLGLAAVGGSGLDNPTPAAVSTGAAGIGTPNAAGAAAPKPRPHTDLDPNITFDWQETAPGAANSDDCRPGVYTGTFDCSFVPDPGTFGIDTSGFAFDVSGPLSIELAQSANGEFLQIANGQLSAVAELFFGFRADLNGQLDCKTLQLAATTQGGMWALGDPDMPLLPGGTLDANIDGALDPVTHALAGQWSFVSGSVPGTCSGTWNATFTP